MAKHVRTDSKAWYVEAWPKGKEIKLWKGLKRRALCRETLPRKRLKIITWNCNSVHVMGGDIIINVFNTIKLLIIYLFVGF